MSTRTQSTVREVLVGPKQLPGTLTIPHRPIGTVVFAHGSGSSRWSPRNRFVARYFEDYRLASLLFDLLDEEESEDRNNVFDIELLAERLIGAIEWVGKEPITEETSIGLFGASTGVAAALVAAAAQPAPVAAVVSRGGRPDLAIQYLPRVKAPTLLIVGGNDTGVLELNRKALDLLCCESKLEIVPGATHLFPEPGALEQVAFLASQWFQAHLASGNDDSN